MVLPKIHRPFLLTSLRVRVRATKLGEVGTHKKEPEWHDCCCVVVSSLGGEKAEQEPPFLFVPLEIRDISKCPPQRIKGRQQRDDP